MRAAAQTPEPPGGRAASRAPQSPGAAGIEPLRVGGRWMTLFALMWLAVWTVQLTPIQLLLPIQLDSPDSAAGWIGGVVSTGVVLGIGGLAGVIAGPISGMLSDRSRTRWGRRRPWLAGGAVLTSASLVITGTVAGPWRIGAAWTGVSIGIAVMSAALTAMIADQLPERQRGAASGIASSTQAVGIIVGVGTVVLLGLGVLAGYLVMAGFVLVAGIAASIALPDPPARAPESARTAESAASRIPIGAAFRWMLAGRMVLNLANALPTTLLLFFIMYGLGKGEAAEDFLLIAIVIYTVFSVLASVLVGWLSDRRGSRRGLAVISAGIQAVAAAVIAISPTWEMTVAAAALLGIGFGGFMTATLALATDLLPDAGSHARDLGLTTVAAMLGQIFGPLIGAALVALVGGFWLLLVAATVLSVAGGALTALARR